MKIIEAHRKEEVGYEKVFNFAKEIYLKDLSFTLIKPPDFLFSANDGLKIFGCIGLNVSVKLPLITRNPNLQHLASDKSVAEQSVLAVDNCSRCLPILIAVLARYAHYLGFKKMVFAGIGVSIKTVERLGFSFTEYWPVQQQFLLPEEKPIYAKWFSLYKPVICVGEISLSVEIIKNVLNKFNNYAKLSENLQKVFLV